MERRLNSSASEYPYASRVTYEFLRAAISEGAHHKIPETLEMFSDGESRWARIKNISGLYFSTDMTEEDIGKMYGYGKHSSSDNPNRREGPRKEIKRFIAMLWKNCSRKIQDVFPLDEIVIRKPLPEKCRVKRSISTSFRNGGAMIKVLDALSHGLVDSGYIARDNGLSLERVNATKRLLRRRGYIDFV